MRFNFMLDKAVYMCNVNKNVDNMIMEKCQLLFLVKKLSITITKQIPLYLSRLYFLCFIKFNNPPLQCLKMLCSRI